MNIKQHIPNTITLLNLLCGCLAIVAVYKGDFSSAALLILLGGLFDFFDGFVARMLKVQSELGKQLDSLGDVVTFGVAPAFITLHFISSLWPANPDVIYGIKDPEVWLGFFAFLLPMFSAIRLGKFNLDPEQSVVFKGLPTPASGIFFSFLPLVFIDSPFGFSLEGASADYLFMLRTTVIMFIFIFCLLMVSDIPMFSMKVKHFRFKGNRKRITFLPMCIVLLVIFQWGGLSLCIILYILSSLFYRLTGRHEVPSSD